MKEKRVFTDLAALKGVEVRPPEEVVEPVETGDDGAEALEYFGRGEKAAEEDSDADAYKVALEDLAREKVAAEARADGAEDRVAELSGRIGELEKKVGELSREVERLTSDNARLRDEASKREAPAAETVAPVAEVPRKGVLNLPTHFDEAFNDEIRELVIASLTEYEKNIAGKGYDRRDAVLKAVLAANPPSGERERREAEIRQIFRDAGYYNDPKALERLGFRLVSGRTHWKVEYAGVRMTIAKTPSDHRAASNTAADIANRCF